jgi:hypothetical protein
MKTFSAQVIFLIVLVLVVLFLASILPPRVDGFVSYSDLAGNSVDTSHVTATASVPTTTECQQTFDGLHCGIEKDSKSVGDLDPFYGFKSDMHCQHSGLMKSNGNVCLDDNTYHLLTTRGGNYVP